MKVLVGLVLFLLFLALVISVGINAWQYLEMQRVNQELSATQEELETTKTNLKSTRDRAADLQAEVRDWEETAGAYFCTFEDGTYYTYRDWQSFLRDPATTVTEVSEFGYHFVTYENLSGEIGLFADFGSWGMDLTLRCIVAPEED